jgi:hypothetical protein
MIPQSSPVLFQPTQMLTPSWKKSTARESRRLRRKQGDAANRDGGKRPVDGSSIPRAVEVEP